MYKLGDINELTKSYLIVILTGNLFCLMLSRLNRLTRNKDFQRIYDQGQTYRSPYLTIKVLKNELLINRFGIVVNKKISKKAVTRNKIKRRIRHLFSKELFQLKPGYDIMVITYPKIRDQEYKTIKENLTEVLRKAKLL